MEEKNYRKLRILVAPLDWGLGHATRCIPVIRELIKQGAEVLLAGEGAQQVLLTKEFPELTFLPLKGYRIKYGRSSFGLLWNILFQTRRILKTIKEENELLKETVNKYSIDAVISDNRFGLYHSSVPSVFITHQLRIKTPLGNLVENILQRRNYGFIDRFTECWIPDNDRDNNLSGKLSHPRKLPQKPIHYIGALSRLKKNNIAERKGHLFISLSGPEPQRTIFENIIVNQISHYNGTATIVRGLPASNTIIPSTNDIKFYNHLPASEYGKEMEMAEFVISRSGYSSVMDIMTLGKKSILIPTPGQTEQEYLGKYLLHKKKAFSISQREFSFAEALKSAGDFEYNIDSASDESKSGQTISLLLNRLRNMPNYLKH